MKLRAYLVDDEPLALERLRRLLERTGQVDVIGSATEPEQAVAALTGERLEVCFLDIHMPRLSGFDVLARLPDPPAVIFTTAYDQYALQAFEANAVDYLLKPVEPGRLERSLAKLERMRAVGPGVRPDLHQIIRQLADSLHDSRSAYPDRIASRLGERIWFLDLPRVTHFYAQDKLTFAVSDGKAYCVDYTIAGLERLLNPRKFLRIHRSTIVNVACIREVAPLPGGSLSIRLQDGRETELIVARDRARDFRQQLGC